MATKRHKTHKTILIWSLCLFVAVPLSLTGSAAARQRVNVNAAEPNGTTPLHNAVYQEDAELVERLLKAGAKASVVNDFGSTPMSEAAAVGNAGCHQTPAKGGR